MYDSRAPRGPGAGRGQYNDDDDNYGSRSHSHRPYQQDDEDFRRPQSYESQGQDQGRGYGSGFAAQGGIGRGDFASDKDIAGSGRDYVAPSYGQRSQQRDDDDFRRPQSYQTQTQDQGRGRGYGGYAPPSGPPSSGRGSALTAQGGLDRGDFASDADIAQMVSSGEFGGRGNSGRQEHGSGYGASSERRDGYGRQDEYGSGYGASSERRGAYNQQDEYGSGYGASSERRGAYNQQDEYGSGYGASTERRDGYGRQDDSSGPRRSQGHEGRTNDYGRYDAPSGPPSGRGYQGEQSYDQGRKPGYGGGSDRSSQYGQPQTQGRIQRDHDSSPAPSSDYGRSKGNAPAGGFSTSRDEENRYGSGYSERTNDRSETPRRGEASDYYNQQGRDDRYTHLAGLAKEHGDDDPELYRRATQGLDKRIQAQSRPQGRDDDDDYKAHIDAHRKAYGGDDNRPMSPDAIGRAAAMEAIKQAAPTGNTPAGGFQAGKSGGPSSKTGKATEEEEQRASGGAGGGLQDKMMALAMSQAGKLFDQKNAGSSGGKKKEEDKAQAMQSAAATAMQLFGKYKTGKLDSSDMSSVMTLAMKMM